MNLASVYPCFLCYKPANGFLKMCHETNGLSLLQSRWWQASQSLPPTWRGEGGGPLPGPLTQNTLCRGWPELESWLRCVCVGGEVGGGRTVEVAWVCYQALLCQAPGSTQKGPLGEISLLAVVPKQLIFSGNVLLIIARSICWRLNLH